MVWRRALLVVGLASTAFALSWTGADAQATCTGNRVIDQAPFSCTDSRVINGITFSIVLNVDAAGRAVVDYTMAPVQATDVPIAVHSYTRIDADPRQFINGTIPAGQTTAQLVVPRVECGQLDIKAVDVTPGALAGLVVGPQVTWGVVCQQVPTTTTSTTISPTSTGAPTSIRPTQVPTSARRTTSTLPSTGLSSGGTPWALGLLVLAVGCGLVVLPRRWRD
jgi:hypothetical protein